MGKAYTLRRKQHIEASPDRVWEFVAAPSNLKKITPPYMGFDITSDGSGGSMYEGMIITYRVSPLAGIKMNWVTEITHVEEGRYFVDDQRSGPYAIWHHQHFVEPDGDGTLMTDIVTYMPPFGILGRIANRLIIRRRLKEIFEYREKAMILWAKQQS
jgi:ligand-binding SRPBCC domain-containing protein